MTVVSDAGSTSTSAALKKIVLNHLQLLGLSTSFDLNWNTNSKEFFNTIGAISSVGDQLIQSGCILNSVDVGMPAYYFKQMLYIIFTLAFIIGSIIFWNAKSATICERPKMRRARIAMRAVEQRRIRRKLAAQRKVEGAKADKSKLEGAGGNKKLKAGNLLRHHS